MLNNETINKIAAGEVIIRPVSVVKELVENAIDAGADQIEVIVEAGGKNRITVRDNGCGIAFNEIPLAFKRHATSKLSTIEELEEIESLGFRGEALSSVAAVAKVQITTRFENEEIGSQALFEGGKLIHQRVCAYNRGTDITVKDLFYNTPARRKHLEKDKKEESILRDQLEKIAILHPGIRFQLSSNGRMVLDTSGTGKVIDVVKKLYGGEMADNLITLKYENKPMKLEGFVGNLKTMRNHREDQMFFINGRFIKNNRLSKALDEAFDGYRMKHQHPLGIIFIELPGRMLDVNIHPAKTEIKILNESLVCLLFKQGIRETLRNTSLIVELGTTHTVNVEEVNKTNNCTAEKTTGSRVPDTFANSVKESSVLEVQNDQPEEQTTIETVLSSSAAITPANYLGTELPSIEKRMAFGTDEYKSVLPAHLEKAQNAALLTESLKAEKMALSENGEGYFSSDQYRQVDNALSTVESSRLDPGKGIQASGSLTNNRADIKDLTKMKIVGQLFNVYILLEGEKEIYLLDQHAAHEAFLTQELMHLFNRKEVLPNQGLMTPTPLKIRPKDLLGIEQTLGQYKSLGYDCDVFGEDTLLVRSVPILLGEPQSPDLLKLMINENLFEYNDRSCANNAFSEKVQNKIISMACKAAIKGGQALTQVEIKNLLENLMNLDNPYTCPHGRPIILRLKEYELMKLFKRVI
ncbi:DNA mismatch repair endonuclease MutL [Acetobacterium wieringae]|uniref:DNA mismatch repair endonuclease MutL n=1 Tax=Acetobacterium wieringae TaxID=52694 RepID=UPI0026ECAF40|nr:DNA mismatch repair endonuclease MutL [Acetobacterium wieringae]